MESEGKGSRAPASVECPISTQDVRDCLEFALAYVADKQHAGRNGWRGGFVQPFTAAGIYIDKPHACTVVGKLGEIALCRLAQVPVDFAIHKESDNGVDLVLPSGTVQVKTATGRDAVRYVRRHAERADYFAFASLDIRNGLCGRSVYLDGYLKKSLVRKCKQQPSSHTDDRGNPVCENFVVPIIKLYPIRSLLRIPAISR